MRVNILDNSIISADIHWGEPITVPFDNKLQFGDSGIFIWADDDGILDIVSDTSIQSSAAWTHTGNFTSTTYGAAAVTDAELGYLDGVSSSIQTQLDAVNLGTGTDNHLVKWNSTDAIQDTGIIVDDSDNITGVTSLTLDGSATPGMSAYDSDGAGATDYSGKIVWNMTTTTDDAETADVGIYTIYAGDVNDVGYQIIEWDGSAESFIIGDPTIGEDLQFDLSTAGTITVTSPGGGTEINYSALQMVTTGDIMGGINVSSKAGAYTIGTDDAHEAYGTMFTNSNVADLTLPASPAVGMSGCLMQEAGVTGIMKLQPEGTENLVYKGVEMTAGTDLASAGAATDRICWVAITTDHWLITTATGTWAE